MNSSREGIDSLIMAVDTDLTFLERVAESESDLLATPPKETPTALAEEEAATPPKEQAGQNSVNLDLALIKHIIKTQCIMDIQDNSIWQEFQKEHNMDFGRFTWVDIREHFTDELLPRIFEYELDRDAEVLFSLLDINPNLERTGRGYLLLPTDRQITNIREPKLNKDFSIATKEAPKTMKSKAGKLELPSSDEPHTVIGTTAPTRAQASPLSKENHALMSAFFSSDIELATCALLDINELKSRLAEARKRFQETGQLPPNAMPADQLVPKLEAYCDTAEVLESLVNDANL